MTDTPLSQRPRAILFDYDGVLVSSEPIHLAAWMQLLAELGLPQDTKTIQQLVGKTAPEVIARLLDLHRPSWDPAVYDIHDLARRKNIFYLELAKKGLQPYPGVMDGLQWLREQGFRTAVVSNGKRNELEKTMKHLNLFDLFDQVISRDDAKSSKPDPTPYLMGAALLQVDPQECIAIEDSPTGLEAALLAKIPVAGVLSNFPKETLEYPIPGRPELRPHWIFQSIQDFFSWLKRS